MFHPGSFRYEFDNAADLDAFYIAASQGWDFETGEVFDLRLHKYYAAQGFPITEHVEPKIELDIRYRDHEFTPYCPVCGRSTDHTGEHGNDGSDVARCQLCDAVYADHVDPENMQRFWEDNDRSIADAEYEAEARMDRGPEDEIPF